MPTSLFLGTTLSFMQLLHCSSQVERYTFGTNSIVYVLKIVLIWAGNAIELTHCT